MKIWEEKTKITTWEPTGQIPQKDKAITSEKWVVITSIFEPSDEVKILASQPGWKVVVVGDRKSPKDWKWENCVFLSVKDQLELGYRITKLLPYDHYARKNIGYLYAIQHGAKAIYDIDDDNMMSGNSIVLPPEVGLVQKLNTPHYLVNPYATFGRVDMWPRGFPLEEIRGHCTQNWNILSTADTSAAIIQGLADHDPDVDAIHRLTKHLPVQFKSSISSVVIPKGTFAPFNSQNTLFHYSGFWGLLIPMTTTFRVCDIWRSYWAQRILWEINSHLSFTNATVIQVRNPHNYLADFDDELELYHDAGRLVKYLRQWVPETSDTLVDAILRLHKDMAAAGFWKRKEVSLTEAWLKDLIDVGYNVPKRRNDRI